MDFPQVYDLTSGQLIRTFYDQRNASFYTKNFACFGPGDDLLLNDGCLWDVRSRKFIHKFDKFNDFVSGVFNPSGLEIIINSEVVSFSRQTYIYTVIFMLLYLYCYKTSIYACI